MDAMCSAVIAAAAAAAAADAARPRGNAEAKVAGRGLHSSTSQLNLSRV